MFHSNRRPFRDLQEFVHELERHGDVLRIRDEVDPYLEASAIAQIALRKNGPALIFERIRGARYPLVMNLFGSEDRIRLACGRAPRDIGEELVDRLITLQEARGRDLIRNGLFLVLQLLRSRPKHVRRAMVHEIEDSPNLSHLPILTTWPGDGGPFITFGLVLTEHPVRHTRNLGLYRMHVYDNTTTGMHWQSMKGGRGHYYEAEKQNKPLEVAVILGCDPITMLSAVFPLPEEMDELMWSGFLRGKSVLLVRGKSISLSYPAHSEWVLEGIVPPKERRIEGPFGDHFGHYSSAHPFPVFHIQKMFHRRRPLIPATVVGPPPQEDWYLGIASGEIIGPLIRLVIPSIHKVWASPEAGFHHLLIASVESRHPNEVMRTAFAILGQGQLAFTKVLVLVPPDIDVRSFAQVWHHVWRTVDARKHIHFLEYAPADTLDFTTREWHIGGKMIINATEEVIRTGSPPNAIPFDVHSLHSSIIDWKLADGATLILQLRSHEYARTVLKQCLEHPWIQNQILWIFTVSDDVPLDDPILLIWGIFTRFDPAEDVVMKTIDNSPVRPGYTFPIGIDATWKPRYPAPLTLPQDVWNRAHFLFQKAFSEQS